MNQIYNNEIVFRIYKKLSKLNNKKQTIQVNGFYKKHLK